MHRSAMRGLRLIALACLAGCAHADALENGALHKGDLTLQLGPIPENWRRIQVDGGDLAYRDEARGASALLDVRCRRGDDAPLVSLTAHLIIGTTDRAIDKQEVVAFDGREALHTLLYAKLDGVPMRYDIYVLKKDGCVDDFVYVAPPEHFQDGAAEFERFALGAHAHSSAPLGRSARDP
jgi:hypothetical protein